MKATQLRALLLLAGAALAAGSFYAGRQTSPTGAASMPVAASASAPEGRKVLYWHDPMVPGQRFDKPGKSPFMDMQLVPMYADSASEAGAVKISPTVQQNLGIRFAAVRRAEVASSFDAVVRHRDPRPVECRMIRRPRCRIFNRNRNIRLLPRRAAAIRHQVPVHIENLDTDFARLG